MINRHLVPAILLLSAALCCGAAAGTPGTQNPSIPPPAKTSVISKASLTQFGAKGDGTTDDADAFQRALDSGITVLDVPAGVFKIGHTLRIHGGTHLRLDPQATLRLADGTAKTTTDYLLANANPESGDANIVITGGTWDGNNTGNPRPTGLFNAGYSGAMLHFQNVTGLRLENLHLHNAEAFYARFTHVRDFHIEGIAFSSSRVRHNNDGIHLGGNCENGVIRNIKGLHPGVTGDDLVALNADDALNRTEVHGMTCGPIRNVRIENLEAEGCHSFVRMLSVWSPIENVTVDGVRGTCEIAALNCDAARGCRVPLFDEAHPPFPNGVGLLRNIRVSNFRVAKSAANKIALLRLETRMENVVISDFRRELSLDQSPQEPTLRFQHACAERLTMQPGDVVESVKFGERYESNQSEIKRLGINEPVAAR